MSARDAEGSAATVGVLGSKNLLPARRCMAFGRTTHGVTGLWTDPARCPIGRALLNTLLKGGSVDFSKLSWRVDQRRLRARGAGSRPRSSSTRPSRPCLCRYLHPSSLIKVAILRPDLDHSIEAPEPASL